MLLTESEATEVEGCGHVGPLGSPLGVHRCGRCRWCVVSARPTVDMKIQVSSSPVVSSGETPNGHQGEKVNLNCGPKVCRGVSSVSPRNKLHGRKFWDPRVQG